MLRPALLLPPKRLSTLRSARDLSIASWSLLPGVPVLTWTGLTPVGPVKSQDAPRAKAYARDGTTGRGLRARATCLT